MTEHEAIEEIRRSRKALEDAEREADLQWRDKVSGLRAMFARDAAAILSALDSTEEPF